MHNIVVENNKNKIELFQQEEGKKRTREPSFKRITHVSINLANFFPLLCRSSILISQTAVLTFFEFCLLFFCWLETGKQIKKSRRIIKNKRLVRTQTRRRHLEAANSSPTPHWNPKTSELHTLRTDDYQRRKEDSERRRQDIRQEFQHNGSPRHPYRTSSASATPANSCPL